ncbi:MAG TPA: hypothetical protein VNI57_16135, partial [Candidatus Saccharimonadales bacterium]|nr:hypothetical protein [Candidatus Saccharimonadales bacterium]
MKIWRENGEAELAGYIVPEKPGELDAPAVRRALLERIPKYMLPARFVFLDSLPLNTSGKVNRHALPRPGREPVRRGPARAMTPAEESIAAIWRLVLRIREV